MEYEKSPTATTFSRKMNNRSRSLSFSANAVYDGVFSSPANSKSPLVDYSEIFRGSGPSPSSIPFLDVPELNGGKIKVDVRSTKLDYSSVFGGFGVCEFDVTTKEVIIKSEKKTSKKEDKRNRRKSGNSGEVSCCSEGKNRISSPEMVRMKHADISYHQAGFRGDENGTMEPSEVFAMPGPVPTQLVENVNPLRKIESKVTIPSVKTMPGAAPTQLVENVSPLPKIESKVPVPSVKKETCPVAFEEVKVSRNRSSKNEVDFRDIFCGNGSSTRDQSTCKTDSVAEHWDVKPPPSLPRTFTGENGASERLMGWNSGLSERCQTEDTGSPGSPIFFDAETDADSSAAESSAALKKALEEAQVRMNIAKQMMDRKKSGFRSSPKPKSCDDHADDKRDTKIEITEENRSCNDLKADDRRGAKVEIAEESRSCNDPKADDRRDTKVEEITEKRRSCNDPKVDDRRGTKVEIAEERRSCNDPKADDRRGTKVEITEESRSCNDLKADDRRDTKVEEITEERRSCDDPKADDRRGTNVEIAEERRSCNDPKAGDRRGAKVEITEESRSCNDPKAEDRRDAKVEEVTEESRDDNSHILDELVNSSEQSFSNEGDQHAKRARKQWGVPKGLLKSTPGHTQEEIKEKEVVKQEEEQAKRGRKHWELPGGIFKSVMKSKQREPENIVPTKPDNDTKQEVQPLTENPFYTFGQLGSKLKCVVEAFTGSKVSQKDETQVTEKESSFLTHIFEVEERDSQDMLNSIPVMETYLKAVEETSQQTESRNETKIEDNSESTTCTFTEECSQKMEKEASWEVNSVCESQGGPNCGVKDFQENPEPTYNFLDQEGDREIVTETQEVIVSPDDTEMFVREVEEIPTPSESSSRTQFDESVGTMVSIHKENTSEPEIIHEEKETEQKAPRRRRVWQTSEDVYNMIKAPIGNYRPWHLENTEKETIERPFQVEGVRPPDASEETENTSEQASDSGLQENWTVLKQMFRQMFQAGDTKGDDETYCLVESVKDQTDNHTGDENGKETTETSYCRTTGADLYEHNTVETVESEYVSYAHIRENEDLDPTQETYCRKEDVKVEMQGKTSLVRELIGEELQAIGMASDREGEYVQEVFEGAGWPEGLSEHDEVKEHADSRAEMLEYDRSETDSNKSCEESEQRRELADETKIDGSMDTDTSRSSFEMRQGDSYTEEVGIEQDLSDQFHEKTSAASSTEEHIEEIDSDSIQSGWSVIEDDDKIKSYVEESLIGHRQDGGARKPEEKEETKEEIDEMKTSLGVENNEDKTEQEHQFDCPKEETDRSNVEPVESSCCLPKGDGMIGGAADRNMKDNDGEETCRSSIEEEGDAASSASQNEVEQVGEYLMKKDEAKEKERERENERVMVERIIREARERAFADAKERAGKAAMEKAKAKAHRRVASEVPKRSEKGSVEVNDKLSSVEKASLQAKLRAERAAVERAQSEARERALEKALSGKSAAPQTRCYGGSKSFSSAGEKRGSSSSGTENKNSGPSSSSNQTAKAEPIQRCKARSERHQRTSERAAEALAEKKLRDLKAQQELAERNRLSESVNADVKRWSSGKESNLRALLSTLQYILGAESGWKPIPLTELVSGAAVRKAYRKATLYVHPDKLQQRGASPQQKYICEKVFDLLKEAWDKFGADDR